MEAEEDGKKDDLQTPRTDAPPDGGYGWIICAVGFFGWMIGDGVAFSYGVLYVTFLEEFGGGPVATAWVGSAFIGAHNLTSPVAGVFIKKFGCRATVCAGSMISTVGFILSAFSPSILMLTFTLGILGGAGLNFILVASVEMVVVYFKKRRSLANGIVTCGAGVGGFILPLLLNFLIDKYHWRGALLLIGGVCLNGCVVGALMRPLDIRTTCTFGSKKGISGLLSNGGNVPSDDQKSTVQARKTRILDGTTSNMADDPSFLMKPESAPCYLSGSSKSLSSHEAEEKQCLNRGQNRDDLVPSAVLIGSMASLSGIDIRRSHVKKSGSIARTRTRCSSCSATFGLGLIPKNPFFLFVILSCTFWTSQTTMFIYLIDYALSRGLNKTHGTLLLSIIGILNTIGRVLVGLMTDHPKVDFFVVYGVSLVVAGVVNMVVPLCTNFAVLATCSAVFGLCVASFVSLRAIIIVEILGVDQMIQGFGLTLFCQGIGFLVGPPIAAVIYEASATYLATFLTSGTFLFLAAVAIIPARFQHRKYNQNNGKHYQSHDIG